MTFLFGLFIVLHFGGRGEFVLIIVWGITGMEEFEYNYFLFVNFAVSFSYI